MTRAWKFQVFVLASSVPGGLCDDKTASLVQYLVVVVVVILVIVLTVICIRLICIRCCLRRYDGFPERVHTEDNFMSDFERRQRPLFSEPAYPRGNFNAGHGDPDHVCYSERELNRLGPNDEDCIEFHHVRNSRRHRLRAPRFSHLAEQDSSRLCRSDSDVSGGSRQRGGEGGGVNERGFVPSTRRGYSIAVPNDGRGRPHVRIIPSAPLQERSIAESRPTTIEEELPPPSYNDAVKQ